MGIGKLFVAAVAVGALGALGWAVRERLREEDASPQAKRSRGPVPVEVVPVERRALELRRTFSGTLEAPAEFVVSPKVGGRVVSIEVDLGDTVRRGAGVAQLDDDEIHQAIRQAEAGLAVARAQNAEAESALEIAERGLARVETLSGRGVASDAQLDAAKADAAAKRAQVKVAAAQVTRAEAALEAARIRLGYTRIVAEWSGGADERVVAERHVDPGDTVSPGRPLLGIVELDTMLAVIHVPERDYGKLQNGQAVKVTTDAFPKDVFAGTVARIAPVFRRSTRQARVEVSVPNGERRLKPGMFVRATVVLERVEDACTVPEEALARRGDVEGVFQLADDRRAVAWRAVRTGIREGGRVEILGDGFEGFVVTLGQQLLEDGASVVVPDDEAPPARGGPGSDADADPERLQDESQNAATGVEGGPEAPAPGTK